jgi:hypothetical protein
MAPETTAERLHQVFYCSVLTPGESPHAVSDILAQARRGNAELRVTGLLIFDGLHFLQYLEGPHDPVQWLMARITADPRHTGLHVIHQGELAARRCSRFEMGFAEPAENDDAYDRLVREGEAGLQHFLALRPIFDIQS